MTYLFDPTGAASTNLVTSETQNTVKVYQNVYLIIPDNGPFYSNNLVVTYTSNGNTVTLQEGLDYQLVLPFYYATRTLGIPTYGAILPSYALINEKFTIQYQTVGGEWIIPQATAISSINSLDIGIYNLFWDMISQVTTPFPSYNDTGSLVDNSYDYNSLDTEINDIDTTVTNKAINTNTLYLYDFSISGPPILNVNETGFYSIINYNPNAQYIISTINGSVIMQNGVVQYTAPDAVGFFGFTINGIKIFIEIIGQEIIVPPYITSPVNYYITQGTTLTVDVTPFQSLYVYDTLKSVNWELATDSGFTNIVQQSLNDTVNIASWKISGLLDGTQYYVRVQFNGNNSVQSAWSAPVTFTTNNIATPSITSPTTGATGEAISLTITSSTFSATNTGDTQASSNWELAYDSGFTNIVQSLTYSTSSLTSWSVSGLNYNTVYYVRVQYNSGYGLQSQWSSADTFTTIMPPYPSTEVAELVATNGASSDQFGWSVALNSTGTIALIGAINFSNMQGAAYVFTNSGGTWSQTAELVATDGATSNNFGCSVAFDSTGTIALIGAYDKTVGSNSYQGAAYVFTNSGGTWSQTAELVATDGATGDNFGWSVALDSTGTIALIGAYGKTVGSNPTQGAAYIFTNSGGTWSQTAELVATDGTLHDQFGYSVALDSTSTIAIIGANNREIGTNNDQGAAYIFTNSGGTWSQIAELVATNGAAVDNFGNSVALDSTGTIAIIGAYYKTVNGNANQGAAYIFD